MVETWYQRSTDPEPEPIRSFEHLEIANQEEGGSMDSYAPTETIPGWAELSVPDAVTVEIYCWRVEVLERAGYSGAFAHLLADDTEIDLHRACDLIARGCAEATAYAILS